MGRHSEGFFFLCISLLAHQFLNFVHEKILLKGENLPVKQLISSPKDVKQTAVCNFHIIFINGASLFPLTVLTSLLRHALFAQFPHVALLMFTQPSLHTHSFSFSLICLPWFYHLMSEIRTGEVVKEAD